jgi:hypothetical protein
MSLYFFHIRNNDHDKSDQIGAEPIDLATDGEPAVVGERRLMSAESLFQPAPSDRAAA